MATTSVLFVHPHDAKALKSKLEEKSLLDKRFRMGPSSPEAIVEYKKNPCVFDGEISDYVKPPDGRSAMSPIESGKFIAVPVTDECIDSFENYTKGCSIVRSSESDSWETYAVASGRQRCQFSTSTMGNQNHIIKSRLAKQCRDRISNKRQHEEAEVTAVAKLTNIQCVLIETIIDYHVEKTKKSENDLQQVEMASLEKMVETAILSLSIKSCPKKLELIGDDRTLVVPSTAFLLSKRETPNEFHQVLLNICGGKQNDSNETNHQTLIKIQENLWKKLANLYQSPRVVRRGDIDPESGIRESGHRILWPLPESIRSSSRDLEQFTNDGYTPESTGPDSSGWITVTEHKISQSFDLTRVMFSRGNVTEKKRFGQLVQPNERVLDMYAGIGYYTLPSLVHGHAKHTVACEWNPNAVFALRHNLKANKVDDRATVLEGDCRSTLRRLLSSFHEEDHQYFDRISLGLLPSSEGGWPIAIECLNRQHGGWLHVHGNVAITERQQWAHWLCRSLVTICKKHSYSTEWQAICNHIERVKSFAPKVDHYVADVFVGPLNSPHLSGEGMNGVKTTGVFHSGNFTATPLDVPAPSCALDSKGIIHQEWMMSNSE